MNHSFTSALRITRRAALVLSVALLGACAQMAPATDPLPSWKEGAGQGCHRSSSCARPPSRASPQFVPAAQRVATFDQDGTLWVEQPMYAQVAFALDRVKDVVKAQPALANEEPFKAVLKGDRAAMANSPRPICSSSSARHRPGSRIEAFREVVKAWAATAKHPKFQRPYAELVYAPMFEAMNTYAPMATAPTLSPAAGRNSCGPLPKPFMACRPSRSSAAC